MQGWGGLYWFCRRVLDALPLRMSWLPGITGYGCSVEHYPSSSCSTSRSPNALRIPHEQQSAVLCTAWPSARSISSGQQTASLSFFIVKSSALSDMLLDAKGLGAISRHFHARYHIVDQQRQSSSVRARSLIILCMVHCNEFIMR